MGNLLGSGAAVNSPHGDAESPRLKEVMVGKAFNELDDARSLVSRCHYASKGRSRWRDALEHTSGWLPLALKDRFWHSLLRSGRLRAAYKVLLSETLAGWAELAPVMCNPRRMLGVAVCCWDSRRKARNDDDRGAAMMRMCEDWNWSDRRQIGERLKKGSEMTGGSIK